MFNIMIDFSNFAIDTIVNFINSIIQLLPDSPFTSVNFSFLNEYIPNLNWLIPINEVVIFLGIWTSAILSYYIYTIVLRFTNAID